MFKSSDLNQIDFTRFNRIGIAYSGGVDSHVLLHSMLKEFGNSNLYALHIDHGLTKNSDKWEISNTFKKKFISSDISVTLFQKINFEREFPKNL